MSYPLFSEVPSVSFSTGRRCFPQVAGPSHFLLSSRRKSLKVPFLIVPNELSCFVRNSCTFFCARIRPTTRMAPVFCLLAFFRLPFYESCLFVFPSSLLLPSLVGQASLSVLPSNWTSSLCSFPLPRPPVLGSGCSPSRRNPLHLP